MALTCGWRGRLVNWQVGCNTYDEQGNIAKKGTNKGTVYTQVYTRDKAGEWKLQMLYFHE